MSDEHTRRCRDCWDERALFHDASVAIMEWAGGISAVASALRKENDPDEKRSLVAAIEGLSWAVEWRARVDIEGETPNTDWETAKANRKDAISRRLEERFEAIKAEIHSANLESVGVALSPSKRLLLKCGSCAEEWDPNPDSLWQLPSGFWRCPKECNSDRSLAVQS